MSHYTDRFSDGVSGLAIADAIRKYHLTKNVGASSRLRLVTNGGIGGRSDAWRYAGNASTTEGFLQIIGSNAATHVMAARYYFTNLGSSPLQLMSLWDGTTAQCSVRLDASGVLQVNRGHSTVSLTLTDTLGYSWVPPTGQWIWLCFKATISTSVAANAVQVYANGALVYNVDAGQNSDAAASGVASRPMWGNNVNNATNSQDYKWHDVLWQSGRTTPFGDSIVSDAAPTGDGDDADWTPSSGMDHYAMVDDATPDDETTINTATTVGERDLFTFPNLPSSVKDILWVHNRAMVRTQDTGERGLKMAVKHSSTVYYGSEFEPPPTWLHNGVDLRAVNPRNGAPWTRTQINALQSGIELTT